ncbi:uncharacterized protein LOC101858552 isoform X2 [Aplysia californica]|nr:uncharacterized protein LOC101858552 isoform X2 [Aplysia californica]
MQFSVRYHVVTGEKSKVSWIDENKSWVTLKGTTEEDGSSNVASVVVPPHESSVVMCEILTSRHRYVLYLENAEDGDVKVTPDLRPNFSVTPDGDFVYQAGTDVTAEVEHWLLNEGSPTYDMFELRFYLQHSLLKLVLNRPPYNFLQEHGQVDVGNFTQYNFSLLTSMYQTNGLVEISVSVGQTQELVKRATVTKTVVLRPSTQAGAFPPGFLQIVGGVYKQIDYDGKVVYCSLGSRWPCYLGCNGVGNDVTAVTISRINDDGSAKQLAVETPLPGQLMTYVGAVLDESELKTVPVRCEVTNAAGDTSAITYQVTFVAPAPWE